MICIGEFFIPAAIGLAYSSLDVESYENDIFICYDEYTEVVPNKFGDNCSSDLLKYYKSLNNALLVDMLHALQHMTSRGPKRTTSWLYFLQGPTALKHQERGTLGTYIDTITPKRWLEVAPGMERE